MQALRAQASLPLLLRQFVLRAPGLPPPARMRAAASLLRYLEENWEEVVEAKPGGGSGLQEGVRGWAWQLASTVRDLAATQGGCGEAAQRFGTPCAALE